MITEVALVPLIVDEYERAMQFYCEKLGFKVIENSVKDAAKNTRWIRIQAPGGKGTQILLSRAADDRQRAAIGNQTGGRVLFFLNTDDFDTDYRRFREAGIEFVEGPFDHGYGKVAVMKDLYGNRIDLIEPKVV